ncbi:hypothetical protein ABZ826_23500 [Streptomyces sp. NPDC047515]|uniref:hypothetical protein n=1 Tax=Streptomyces sp. NPDC047515 TaxID=3155380 RepID=UPI0033C7D282
MPDTIAVKTVETDVDATPETLRIDLAQLHVRSTASPLPKHPAAMGWQMTAGSLAALASRLLNVVQRTAPEEAARIAEWFAGPFGDGPDLEEHTDWIAEHVAGSWDVTETWVQEARQLAMQAQQATAQHETKEN